MPTNPLTGLDLTDEQITQAWVYVLGRYLVVRQEHIDLAEPDVDYNILKHNPPVLAGTGAGSAPTFVNPNLDVVYSEAWIAVDENTPAILEVPPVPAGTYYTAQIVDEWAEIVQNVNDRTLPDHPNGTYALCLTGSDPQMPEDAYRIDLPSKKAKLLTRVQIVDDVDNAVALQHRFAVASSGTPAVDPVIDLPAFTNTAPAASALFDHSRLRRAMAAPDRSGRGPGMIPLLNALSDYVEADPANAAALDEFVHTTAFPRFLYLMTHLSEAHNGWTSTGDRDGFGDDVGFRTAANFAGIWWNSASEAIYFPLQTDAAGVEPAGGTLYRQRFAPGDGPGDHVDGYWSLTVYAYPSMMLVPNPAARYEVSYRSRLTLDGDGGFTLVYATERPPEVAEENWLPLPPAGERFTAILRTYLPRPEVRTGAWTPPAIVAET
ncbi:DUF1214 domain-containing protein [Isoptericola sp. 4D.3]|uniref:DUF1214 domain-containing protein n=1 Tax=Isoptericola peretonis TaxID=2918523 RepID=A0ABT0J4F4_9MICO|nr:DUF1214 domain-containing protein [Isoptericola sp. 4D.3]